MIVVGIPPCDGALVASGTARDRLELLLLFLRHPVNLAIDDRARLDGGWEGALPPPPPLMFPFPLLFFLEPPATEGKGRTTGFVAAAPPRHPPAASGAKTAGGARGEENPATAPWPRGAEAP